MKTTKKSTSPISPILVLVLVILVFLLVALLIKNPGANMLQTLTPPSTQTAINNKNDLQRASTDLNSVNIDQQVDSGLTQLSTESSF